MRNSQQHNQIASQQIKQEHSPAKGEEDRRVRTTNPGTRARPNKQNQLAISELDKKQIAIPSNPTTEVANDD